MTSPQEYRNKIAEIGLNKLEFNTSSFAQVHLTLTKIRNSQNKLWQLKRALEVDINIVRDEQQVARKASISGSLAAIFLGKSTKHKQTQDQLTDERDQSIIAYQKIDSDVDGLLEQLAVVEAKTQILLNEWIAKENRKPKESAGRQTSLVDYRTYIKSSEWRQKAEEAKARAGNRCQVCNRSRAEVQLDAHHRTYERLGYELPEDITVLCRECHQLYEDAKKTGSTSTEELPEKGFCIRCKQSIRLNPQTPYCYSCYKVWKRFENPDYQEKYCHVCGKEHSATMLKPACYDCYRTYRNKLQFQKA
ncbi:MAG: hypothetical protein H6662_10500 [Ardenticatenaceae bacterium]|nr:hypothetical protein [Anaerolineales bacterium]MCB8922004.1 hypothetical protein [Ardenticatenaceae bacterium]MCB8989580.1 hypothetical protein [Ardenticatenaceae bacterium]MCB9003123.1 hypothetical protein [Ardenticatenaceae bacterium]